MKLKWFGMVALSTLLMVGCSEESGNSSNEKLSDEYVESAFTELNENTKTPENVENGKVSEDYYSEVVRYSTEFLEYEEKMLEFQDKLNKNSSLYQDKGFIADYKESLNSYEVFIKSFHLSPKTEADMEINDNLSDTLLYTSYVISSLRKYADTQDSYHTSTLSENMNKRNTSYEAFTNTIKKYDL